MKRRRTTPPPGHDAFYVELWYVVENAVHNALQAHDHYLTETGQASARYSLAKRITGQLVGALRKKAR
jgi:hypothetical protein